MKHASILTLTDAELEAEFWEFIEQSILEENADKYRDEIVWLIQSRRINAIKPVYKKMNATPLFHQARLYLAFWDEKWAIACFKKSISKWENIDDSYFYLAWLENDYTHYYKIWVESVFYPQAQLSLWAVCLDDCDYDAAIWYWENVPSQSREYSNAQHDIAEIYFQRFQRRRTDENLRLAYKHIRNVSWHSELKSEIEDMAKQYNIDLSVDSL